MYIDIIQLINQVLLFWANRDSYGLPVGSNASRILAEAFLVEVDNYLVSKKIDFCRFVDDYRIFAKDAYTAHSHLAILVHCLSREGISLKNLILSWMDEIGILIQFFLNKIRFLRENRKRSVNILQRIFRRFR